jgi:hypothetical protein
VGALSPARRAELIVELAAIPRNLREATSGLSRARLDTRYRNWTIRQIVHHVADSHMNGYIRCRLALTEDRPTIKPYAEGAWSALADAREADVELSLTLVEALHARWVRLLESIEAAAFARVYHHPERGEDRSLDLSLAEYVWHGRHHTAAILWVRARHGWGPPVTGA